jgi:hypothetical protein
MIISVLMSLKIDLFFEYVHMYYILWHLADLHTPWCLPHNSSWNIADIVCQFKALDKLPSSTWYTRDHPYITSAYFWPFWTPPTYLISINTALKVSKFGLFLDPPTQSFCWHNIGMVPKQGRFVNTNDSRQVLRTFRIHLSCSLDPTSNSEFCLFTNFNEFF